MRIVHAVRNPIRESRGSTIASAAFARVIVGRGGTEEQAVLVLIKSTNTARERKRCRLLSFVSAAILWCVAYCTDSLGIAFDRLGPVRGIAPRKRCRLVMGDNPGADTLLLLRRARGVEQLLGLFTAMRAPAPEFFRSVRSVLGRGSTPAACTRDAARVQHPVQAAAVRRRELGR